MVILYHGFPVLSREKKAGEGEGIERRGRSPSPWWPSALPNGLPGRLWLDSRLAAAALHADGGTPTSTGLLESVTLDLPPELGRDLFRLIPALNALLGVDRDLTLDTVAGVHDVLIMLGLL